MKRKMALLSSELSHFSTDTITFLLVGAYQMLFSTNVATYYFIDLLSVLAYSLCSAGLIAL